MAEFYEAQQRDLILFVGGKAKDAVQVCLDYERKYDKVVKALFLGNLWSDDTKVKVSQEMKRRMIDISTDFTKLNEDNIAQLLEPYRSRLLAVTCTKEYNIRIFRMVVPYVPYVYTPTEDSLTWATDKVSMRQRLQEYCPEICPKFMLVSDTSEKTLNRIEKKVGFPLVVKPAGLASSRLVTICYYREEVEQATKKILSSLKRYYKERNRTDTPRALVEEYMDGTMYSIDAYVNSRGYVYHCPPVFVKTGRAIGFDDFFGYIRMAPVQLKEYKIERANLAVDQCIHALGLRNITCHIELMKTEDGWKIIEIGPRLGGYRHDMYKLAFGINHLLNDVLIRIPQKPVIRYKAKQTVAVMQNFAFKEGKLVAITGLKNVSKLESFHSLEVKLKKDDMCKFAKNGGVSVFDVTLAHKSRSQVLADIRRIEKSVKIQVTPNARGRKVSAPSSASN